MPTGLIATHYGLPPPKETVFQNVFTSIDPKTGMHKDYWVLPEEERKKGFIRPLRCWYRHSKCDVVTHMGMKLSETYARDPKFYGATFCCGCRDHFPVGEFTWEDSDEIVGS